MCKSVTEMAIIIINHKYIVNMIKLKTDISDRVRVRVRVRVRARMTMMTRATGR